MQIWPILFVVYWASVLVWLLMAHRVCRGLSQRHPLLYENLGRPALVTPGLGMGSEMALLRFLLNRRDRHTGDESLVRLCGAMRGFLGAYVVFFVTVPGLMLR
jgi:hypothetical protein